MKIETKYNLGDHVYPIVRSGYNGFKICETCNGNGSVTINKTEKTISCPDCYGRGGAEQWIEERWMVDYNSFGMIGKFSVEMYQKKYKREDRIWYMLDSTGVGSGANWEEKNVFKSIEEANDECDRRNNE